MYEFLIETNGQLSFFSPNYPTIQVGTAKETAVCPTCQADTQAMQKEAA